MVTQLELFVSIYQLTNFNTSVELFWDNIKSSAFYIIS